MTSIKQKTAVLGCVVLTLGVVGAGFTTGRRCMIWDGYTVPREVQMTFVDSDGRPIPGVRVEREDVASHTVATQEAWRFDRSESDESGVLEFAIGGTGASGGNCTYFWGLWSQTFGDFPEYGYRFLLDGRQVSYISGDELNVAPADSQTPLAESMFASLEYPRQFGIEAGVERVLLTVTVDGE